MPVERLDLALLVHAQHERPIGRVEIKTDDVAHFVDEQRVGRELEGLGAVRLQTEGVPDAHHRRLRQATRLGHRAAAPVRGIARRFLQCQGDDTFDLRIRDRAGRTRSRLIEQSVEPLREKARAPLAHRLCRHAQLPRNLAVGTIGLRREHDARPQRERLRGLVPPCPLDEPIVLFRRQRHALKFPTTPHRIALEVESMLGLRGCIKVRRINDSGH